MSNKINGLLVTIEGVDGTGKSFQINNLQKYLLNKGYKTHLTKEPGDDYYGSPIGSQVRKILFDKPGTHSLAPGVADLLFLADHVQNEYDIGNLLEQKTIVLCDRYFDSELVYAPINNCPYWILELYKQRSFAGIIPNITILLIAINGESTKDLSWLLNRANNRSIEENNKQKGKSWNTLEKITRIQENYLKLLSNSNRTKIVPIFENDSKQEIFNQIKSIINNELKNYNLDKKYGSK